MNKVPAGPEELGLGEGKSFGVSWILFVNTEMVMLECGWWVGLKWTGIFTF